MKAFVFPTINLSATGMNIQRLRKSRGLSVKDLQEFFGFEAPQAIYKWQSGASLPSVDNLLALSQILEVPMERILVKNELPTPKEPDGSVFLFFLLICMLVVTEVHAGLISVMEVIILTRKNGIQQDSENCCNCNRSQCNVCSANYEGQSVREAKSAD